MPRQPTTTMSAPFDSATNAGTTLSDTSSSSIWIGPESAAARSAMTRPSARSRRAFSSRARHTSGGLTTSTPSVALGSGVTWARISGMPRSAASRAADSTASFDDGGAVDSYEDDVLEDPVLEDPVFGRDGHGASLRL